MTEEGLTTPAFISRLHDEVLLSQGEATNFTSLLRCACLTRAEMGAAAALLARALRSLFDARMPPGCSS